MGILSSLTAAVRRFVVGGVVGTPNGGPRIDVQPGREESLEALGAYLLTATFLRQNEGGVPIAFKLEAFSAEQPTSSTDLLFPSIGILPGKGEKIPTGLTPYIEETTRDLFGVGTVLRSLATDYREVLQLEVWAASRAERRAILAGLDALFSPTEDVYGLRLRIPAFFNSVATFTPTGKQIDESTANTNRRKAMYEVELRYAEQHLVSYVPFTPSTVVDVEPPGVPFADGSTDVETQ